MSEKYYLGLDVGGTKVEGAVAALNSFDQTLKVLSQKKIHSITSGNFLDFIDTVSDLIHEILLKAELSPEKIQAIGIGLPGSLDPQTKIMMNGNTRYLIGKDVITALNNKLSFQIPIFLQNDANLFTLAEAWGGVGKTYALEKKIPFNKQVVLGITLGTGVGGGLVSLGEIYNGAHGASLEVGHITLNTVGENCYCGQRGCAELYLSGTALNKIADSKQLILKAKNKDEESLKILEIYRQNFVHFLSILNNLFNPHYIVFGGGLSNQDILFLNLKQDLEKKIFLSREFCPELYINQLGDSSGLFGAMIYAKELLDS